LGDVGSLLYTQFKAAQSGLSRGLAIEYGRFGITSSVIQLGYLGGGMSDAVPEPRRIEFLARTSTSNPVTTNDFWSLVDAVIHNSSLNGSEINLDGGFR
jgi:3-oxoacyl-[acyl-carrier protein] reductase